MLKVNGKQVDGRVVLFVTDPMIGFFCADGQHTDIKSLETSKCDCPLVRLSENVGVAVIYSPSYKTLVSDIGELVEG